MTYQAFEVDIAEGVAHVVLNRPDRLNTMDAAFWAEITPIFEGISENPEVRVAVISSTGKHFTAGMDLGFFGSIAPARDQDPGRQRDQIRRHVLTLQRCFNAVDRCRVPVLAAIQGGCVGGGVDLTSACDTRYCTGDAWFSIHEINIGMTADLGTLQRMPHLMPSGLLRELAYTGRRLPADEAYACGLVSRVYDNHEALVNGVLDTASEIAARSPLAVVGTKEMLNHARDHSVADGLNYIATWNAAMIVTQDLQEGVEAQAEKRPPRFDPLLPNRGIG
jgi:enoyl-CoA hydratase